MEGLLAKVEPLCVGLSILILVLLVWKVIVPAVDHLDEDDDGDIDMFE